MAKQYWKPSNMLYPVPAVLVSCADENGRPNVMTAAWAGTICSDPVMLSVSIRKERLTHEIISKTGEFVVNLTTEDLAKVTDYVGVKSGRNIDKFALKGDLKLTPSPSDKIKAPGIAESPVSLECKVVQVLELGTHDMFIAEVVSTDIDEKYLDENGKFDLAKAKLLAYSHGEYYGLGEYLGKFGYSVKKN
ncbi:MAG: flavin reductase family protein [Lachnospiraceae bacterium]|nr:flavin reductase family protein [Lachnospiraceae bacterium]